MATFGERMKLLRNEKNISLAELAVDIHTTKATLSRYENSKRTANVTFARKVADYFGVSSSYILGTTDNREIELLAGERLPPELRGIIDAVGVLRGTGLSTQDIQEILELQAKLRNRN